MSARRHRRVALRNQSAPVARSSRQVHHAALCELLELRRLLNGTSIVVNTTADETVANSTTSLREAIALAIATPGDDTITFDPTVFSLVGSPHVIEPQAEPFHLTNVGGKVTIDGSGPGVVLISGAAAGRSFDVDAGANVAINSLRIENGTGASQGGGIRNLGTLALKGVVVNDNDVAGDAGTGALDGGGALGAGIYNTGTLSLDNCVITNNTATGGAGGTDFVGTSGGSAKGGGIYSEGPITAIATVFDGNKAIGGDGGGTNGPTDSTASGGFALGGALFLGGGATGSITNSSITHNSANAGKGGAAQVGHAGGTGGNAFGGAIDSVSTSFTITGGTVSTNSAKAGNGGAGTSGGAGGVGRGGGIYNNGTLTLNTVTVHANELHGGNSGTAASGLAAGQAYGGGIASDHVLHILGGSVTTNFAGGGNGVGGANAGTVFGGGIQSFGDADISDALISVNQAVGGNSDTGFGASALGGGIIQQQGGTFSLTRSTVSQNSAMGGGSLNPNLPIGGAGATGGGILADGQNNLIDSSTIDHNLAQAGSGATNNIGAGGVGGLAQGGGAWSETNLKIVNATIANNTAKGGKGGDGVFLAVIPGGQKTAVGGGGNGGNGEGGGVYATGLSLTTINSTIAYNTAAGGGAGSLILNQAPVIIGGTPGLGRGGGVFTNIAGAAMTNTIIASNTADQGNGPDIFSGIVSVTLIHDLVTTAAETGYNMTGQSTGNESGPANLGPLADNGGPTQTIKPGDGSIAIDHGDNAAALAQFGANGVDQRGVGFPRFNGTVDIGSVEVGAAQIEVSGNDAVIANGDSTPSTGDFTDFGTQFRYSQPVQRTYIVTNTGSATLTLSTPTLPAGYTLIEPLSSSLAKGQADSFTVQLSTAVAGTFSGNVVITTNDPNATTFTYKITGFISPTFKVNFQPDGAPIPVGYVPDVGLTFADRGNGLSYGWNQSIANGTRDRNLLSDQAKDTLVHMQLYGVRTWEVAVPNGTYQVHLVAGDAQYFDSVYKINVEGVLTVNGTPTSGNRFVEGTKTVTVTDGKLTISNADGSKNNKIDFVEITPASFPLTRINFQTTTSPTPNGFLADSGGVFGNRGNGFSYGWNQSASSFARDRNNGLSPDQQHDTFIHTQLYGDRFWELALPNGQYQVHIVAGDPSYTDSKYKYNVEGVLAVNGTPGGGANHWIEGSVTVTVSDGRLTITNASGSVNNKIDYVEIEPAV
jgi:CSLREA domain-containing protein